MSEQDLRNVFDGFSQRVKDKTLERKACEAELAGVVGRLVDAPEKERQAIISRRGELVNLRGVLFAWSLPELLPDYLVYDAAIVGRTGGKVLGDRSVRLGGFFGPDWEGPPARRGR